MRTFHEALRSPAFHAAKQQGGFLSEVAALQRGNLGTGIAVRRIQMTADRTQTTLAWPGGDRVEITAPITASATDLWRLAAEHGPLAKPTSQQGEFPVEPGRPPAVMLTALLDDLGTHSTALVVYRFDASPLLFDAIEADDNTTTVTVKDDQGRQYATVFDWRRHEEPIIGVVFGIVDNVAETEPFHPNETG